MMLRWKKGVTLVEIIIAMAIGSILLIAAGMIQATSASLWLKGSDKVFLQSESSFILAFLSRPVRDATSADVIDNGQILILSKKDGDGNIEWIKTFYKEENDLKYQENEQDSKTLIYGIVDSLVFTFPVQDGNNEDISGGIGINMVLQRGGESFSLQKTFVMRNVGL